MKKENSIKKGIFVDMVNCVSDHTNLLVSLGTEHTNAKTAILIKGESSFCSNKQTLIKKNLDGRMNTLLCQLTS